MAEVMIGKVIGPAGPQGPPGPVGPKGDGLEVIERPTDHPNEFKKQLGLRRTSIDTPSGQETSQGLPGELEGPSKHGVLYYLSDETQSYTDQAKGNQFFYSVAGEQKGRIYKRNWDGSVWSNWSEILDTDRAYKKDEVYNKQEVYQKTDWHMSETNSTGQDRVEEMGYFILPHTGLGGHKLCMAWAKVRTDKQNPLHISFAEHVKKIYCVQATQMVESLSDTHYSVVTHIASDGVPDVSVKSINHIGNTVYYVTVIGPAKP